MIRTRTLISVVFYLFLFTISGYTQDVKKIAQEPNDTFHEIIKAERRAAQNRMQFKANQNTTNYDIKYHRLECTVDPASDPASISGNVTTYWEAVEPMNTIIFDLAGNMNVSQVIQRGDSLTFTHNGDELVVTLPVTQVTGVLDSLTITYWGNPSDSASGSLFGGFVSFNQQTHNGIPILWTESFFGVKEWFPCKQDLKERADSIDVFVTHPQFYNTHEYKTASNGVLVSETVHDSTKTTHWKHRYPIPAPLICIAVTNYSVYHEYAYAGTDHEFPIINYVFPEHLSDVQKYTPVTTTIMELYGDLFEMYPYADEKYGHAEIIANYGMENPTIAFMGVFDDREFIAHELAHEWFDCKVTCGSMEDIWLSEGFATYLDLLTREHLDGNEAFITKRRQYVRDITAKSNGSVFCTDTTSVDRIFDYRLTYKKASMVLHMLRYKLGDTDFFGAIQNYLADPELAFGYARTIDLQNHFEAQSGFDLDNFFADWYTGEGHPSYQLQWNQSGDDAYFLINQSQSHPSVSFFEMPVPVKVNGSDGQSQWLRLENTENGQLYVENVSFPITSVQVDPERELITGYNRGTYSPCLSNSEMQTISVIDTIYLPDSILVTICEDGIIYLVPEDTDTDIAVIRGACIDSIVAISNTPVNVPLSGLDNGTYWLYARDSTGNISEFEAFTIMGVGVEQGNSESFHIYPNPTNSLLTIETESSDHYSINITTLNGQHILIGEMEGASHQVDLSSFQKGVYLITIRSKDFVTTRKIIKM